MEPKLSQTRQKMLNLLMDGRPHTPKELHQCLYVNGPNVSTSNINQHVHHIRKWLKPQGLGIYFNRTEGVYHLVRIISR